MEMFDICKKCKTNYVYSNDTYCDTCNNDILKEENKRKELELKLKQIDTEMRSALQPIVDLLYSIGCRNYFINDSHGGYFKFKCFLNLHFCQGARHPRYHLLYDYDTKTYNLEKEDIKYYLGLMTTDDVDKIKLRIKAVFNISNIT